jgi:hypothetical protein
MPDGRVVTVTAQRIGKNYEVSLKAQPDSDILKWGFAVASVKNEYYTGLMERVVDGPQRASWAPGLEAAMDLRGQKVEMIIKPTTSVYAPFYLSSKGYAILVRGNWPGFYDFAATDPQRVKIEFEGPSFGYLRLQSATDGTGSLRPLARIRRFESDHGSWPNAQRRVLEPSARTELRRAVDCSVAAVRSASRATDRLQSQLRAAGHEDRNADSSSSLPRRSCGAGGVEKLVDLFVRTRFIGVACLGEG